MHQLEFSIREWANGIFVDTKFTELENKDIYIKHLKSLDEYDDTFKGLDIIKKIGLKLLTNARYDPAARLCCLLTDIVSPRMQAPRWSWAPQQGCRRGCPFSRGL